MADSSWGHEVGNGEMPHNRIEERVSAEGAEDTGVPPFFNDTSPALKVGLQ